jgi:hypothetical protein
MVAGERARLDRILVQLSADDAASVRERLLPPCQRKADRLGARDAAICEAAEAHFGLGSGRKIAEALFKELRRYAAAGWRFEEGREPAPGTT